MSSQHNDITLSLISESDVRSKIWKIFPDSVILDQQFNIVALSRNICETLGCNAEAIRGLSVSSLANTPKLKELLEEKLRPGFFEEYQLEIQTKQDRRIVYSISGFYLGLIANINDLIILKFRNLDEIRFLHEQLKAKTLELDNFIYHTAHRLRGPVATLKGLIYLARNTTQPDELDFITSQMNVFANRLDDILHKLIYFAEADKAQEVSSDKMTLASIAEKLRVFAQDESILSLVKFRQDLPEPLAWVENGELILTLLQSIEFFFCQQFMLADKEIYFSGLCSHSFLELSLRISGITLTEKLKKKIETVNFGYVEILNEPEFTSLYAAKKIVLKLQGCVCFTVFEPNEVSVHITIPQCSL